MRKVVKGGRWLLCVAGVFVALHFAALVGRAQAATEVIFSSV